MDAGQSAQVSECVTIYNEELTMEISKTFYLFVSFISGIFSFCLHDFLQRQQQQQQQQNETSTKTVMVHGGEEVHILSTTPFIVNAVKCFDRI